MSHSWSDTLLLSLMPDHVVLVRVRHVWPRKVVDKEIRRCTTRCTADDWSGVLELCANALSESRWRVGRVRVVVSNQLIRYAWVTWTAGLESAAEEEALVRHRLDDIYGAAAVGAAELRWDQSGANRIASALARDGLEGLRTLCSKHSVRLLSVQPLLMAAFNAFRNTVQPSAAAWFAVAEVGLLCIGGIDEEGWRSLRCVRTENAAAELTTIVARERLLAAAESQPSGPEKIFVWSATAWPSARDGVGLHVLPPLRRVWPGFDPKLDVDCAAALLGVGG